jgi:hypothetical protein
LTIAFSTMGTTMRLELGKEPGTGWMVAMSNGHQALPPRLREPRRTTASLDSLRIGLQSIPRQGGIKQARFYMKMLLPQRFSAETNVRCTMRQRITSMMMGEEVADVTEQPLQKELFSKEAIGHSVDMSIKRRVLLVTGSSCSGRLPQRTNL